MKTLWFKRSISWIVTLALMLQIIPLAVLAEDGAEIGTTGPEASFVTTKEADPEAYIVEEDVSKREENVKHFRMSDGAYTAAVYDEPVHYLDNGVWKEIDNTLIRCEKEGAAFFETADNPFRVRFAENGGDKSLVSVSENGYELHMRPVFGDIENEIVNAEIRNTAAKEPLSRDASAQEKNTAAMTNTKIFSAVEYKNAFTGADLQYVMGSCKVKENICVNDRQPEYIYSFEFSAVGLILVLEEDGSVTAQNGEGTAEFHIPAPYMYDQKDARSDAVRYTLTQTGDGVYLLTVIADPAWINAEERAFPVIIDPAIVSKRDKSAITSLFVTSSQPNTPQIGGSMEVGYYSANGTMTKSRGLFNISLPTLGKGDEVVGAQVYLVSRKKSFTGTADLPFHLYKAPNPVTTSVTWNQQASWPYEEILDYHTAIADHNGQNLWIEPHRYDVTRTVRDWYGDESQTGFMVRSSDETRSFCLIYTTDNYTYFGSSSSNLFPVMTVSYRNNAGLEEYWSYISADAGYGGSASVNLFGGNLTVTQPLLSIGGTRSPVAPALVYNSTADAASVTPLGAGWKFNYNVSVNLVSDNLSENGFKYYLVDADGTKHYFYFDSSTATEGQDEDGLGYTLEVLTGTPKYKITNKDGVVMNFDAAGLLTSIVQPDGNTVTVTYASANGGTRISSVKDGANKSYTFTYSGTSNSPTKITDPAGRIVNFTYNSGRLSKCTFPDGKTVEFTYTGGLLTKVKNADGTVTETTYDATAAKRTAQLQWGASSYPNTRMTFAYGNGTTTVQRDAFASNGTVDASARRTLTYQLDTFGHVTGVVDPATGKAQHTAYESPNLLESGTVNPAAHKVKTASATQQSIFNRLANPALDSSVSTGYSSAIGSATGENATFTRDTVKGHAAAGSAKLTRTSASTAHSWAFLYQDVDVSAGTYTLSAYVTTNGTALTTSDSSQTYGALVRFEAYNGGNAVIGSSNSQKITKTAGGEWVRISTTITVSQSCKLRALIGYGDRYTKGTCWFDDVQLESGETVNACNMLDNVGFNGTAGWTGASGYSTGTGPAGLPETMNAVYRTGSPTGNNSIASRKAIGHTSVGDVYAFGAWAKAESAPLNGMGRRSHNYDETTASAVPLFGLRFTFYNGSTVVDEPVFVSYNANVTDWQYVTGVAVAQHAYTHVKLELVYAYNVNTAYFARPYLYFESYGASYTYDEDGNVISVTDLTNAASTFQYNGNNQLAHLITPSGSSFDYAYDETTRQLTSATSSAGLHYAFTYDDYGNPTGAVTTADGNASQSMTSSATYNTNYSRLASVTDNNGATTWYYYDNAGNLTDLYSPNVANLPNADPYGTVYTYNGVGTLTGISQQAVGLYGTPDVTLPLSTVDYTYANTRLSRIDLPGQYYSFTYDGFGRPLVTSVGSGNNSRDLSTNEYDIRNRLTRQTLGNGFYLGYTYDDLDRVTAMSYNGTEKALYVYDAAGRLGILKDILANNRTRYTYDLSGRLVRAEQTANYAADAGAPVARMSYAYAEGVDRLQSYTSRIVTNGTGHYLAAKFVYGTDDADKDKVVAVQSAIGLSQPTPSSNTVSYAYDGFGRRITRTLNTSTPIVTAYAYKDTYDHASARLESLTNTRGDVSDVWEYQYDKEGNVTAISRGGAYQHFYYYDTLGQLIGDVDLTAGHAVRYAYDARGNILTKSTYPNTSGTGTPTVVNYGYTDGSWKDLLTGYNGTALTYDEAGNPLTWRNGMTFTWINGRRLGTAKVNGSTVGTYAYNSDGIRTQKVANGVTTTYYVIDGETVGEYRSNGVYLHYIRDESGRVIGFNYSNAATGSGSRYYFVFNAQGDVVQLVSYTGTVYANYTYDTWGNLTSATNASGGSLSSSSVGAINPFRYRGYYYDAETGLYYLQSRYYDPVVGRFLNVDSTDNLGSDGLFYNLFAYCGNNPVMRFDPEGTWSWSTFFSGVNLLAIGITAVAVATSVLTCGAAAPAMVAIAGATWVAGAATAINGAAEVVEAATNYNVVRDGVMQGNAQQYEVYKKANQMVAEIGTTICGAYYSANGGNVCFVAGTMVLTAAGAVAIETIQAGDLVWAEDPNTGEKSLKQVVRTFENETSELTHVFVNGEEIVSTPTHPFYVPNCGWIAATELRAGDILVLVNGEYVTVEKVQHEILESPVKVYNFEVADFHTYYVSGIGVLVHNRCVAREGNLRADVRVGGDPNHALGHAHIYEASQEIASVTAEGKVLAGQLSKRAVGFVKKHLAEIAEGIAEWYYV